MSTVTFDCETVYADDGSFTIHVGDITFGPYGPDKCPAVHPGGMPCKHWRGHSGCHGTYDYETPAGKFKHRWNDKETF